MSVDRFKRESEGHKLGRTLSGMVPSADGPYVLFADYSALQAELAEARERERRVVEFVARWAWRTAPPHATGKLTDSERLETIKHHPWIARAAQPHIELAERETARAALEAKP